MKLEVQSRAVSHLLNEHRFLEALLVTIESMLEGVEHHSDASRKDLALLIDCLGEFSYLRHEEKEETILLPVLERLGMAWDTGPLPHVRREHRQERYLLRSLRHSALQTEAWDEEDRRHFLAVGHELVDFSRKHMQNEERYLFPEADARLSPELDQSIVEQFTRLDNELDSARDSRELRARANEVLERLASPASLGTRFATDATVSRRNHRHH